MVISDNLRFLTTFFLTIHSICFRLTSHMRKLLLILLIAGTAKAQTYADFRNHMIQYEGYMDNPYRDSLGNWSVGIGHRILDGEPRCAATSEQIERFYNVDFIVAYDWAITYPFFANLPPDLRVLVVALIFNVGRKGFTQFGGFIRAMNRFDYKGAALALHKSRWAKQLPERAASYCYILNHA